MTTLDELNQLLNANENEHLEFKSAQNNFNFEKLLKYCVALANERGGRILFGVTDQRPRQVIGTNIFQDLESIKISLLERLRLRVEIEEINHPNGRVLLVHVPSRPIGNPIHYEGAYWMRGGEGLLPMTPDQLQKIFAEGGPDFSAEICDRATLADLDPSGIVLLRTFWEKKSGNQTLSSLPVEQLLSDAELLVDGQITYAALILLGTRSGLSRHLSQAEVVFEYRQTDATGGAQERREYREGFLLILDSIWNTLNLRNDLQHFQDGLFIWDVPTFSESAVREAVLNAVSHRDYRSGGSVFIRQYPRKLEIVSPGGFLPGITPENVLWRHLPRNRRIAEVLAKCGLVERAGQGFNRIFESCIQQSKPKPDFLGTDAYQVCLTLHGEVQDPNFLRFLEKVGRERVKSFSTEDFLVLDLIHREQSVPDPLKNRLPILIDQGVIERLHRGKASRHFLSRRFHSFLGKKGVYTRKKGLDRETNKALLLQHIRENQNEGSPLSDLLQILPNLSERQVQGLLVELKSEKKIWVKGQRRWARWYHGGPPTEL